MHQTTLAILAVLSGGRADGATILRQLPSTTGGGRAPSLPTMYRHLRDAIDRGWIDVDGPTSGGGLGRPGQAYVLTAAGRTAARKEALHLRNLASAVLGSSSSRKP